MRGLQIALAIFAALMLTDPIPATHSFRVWGMTTASQKSAYSEKLSMYVGWSNGYFSASGAKAFPLRSCIEGSIPYDQAIAMIDKYHDDHPEKWSSGLSDGIVEALTVVGGPCSGKAPK